MSGPGEGDALSAAAEVVGRAERVVVLTGAGISVESGLSTFRGGDGLWEGHDPMQVATPQAFARDPRLVWRFYNERRRRAFAAESSAGHRALAELGRRKPTKVITQNVDRLHQRAGSKGVLELHGNLEDVRCTGCGKAFHKPGEALPELPACDGCGAVLRPEVVWFGEAMPEGAMEAAADAVRGADVLLVVGTSAQVYPAAGLISLARRARRATIEINPTPCGAVVDVCVAAPASEALPALVRAMDA